MDLTSSLTHRNTGLRWAGAALSHRCSGACSLSRFTDGIAFLRRRPWPHGVSENLAVMIRGCRNNAWGNGHCGLISSPLLAPSDRQVHLSPTQLGLSFGLFNYARGRRHGRRHPLPARRLFFLSATSARAFGPQKNRRCKKCGIFGVFAWDVACGAHAQRPASQFGRERRGVAWGDRGRVN